ncbi:MAG: hypothetical protein K6G04_07775 [Lachnospiraceae bacterium]|nr:hypothetical protein [Lachnospiraceae bacterium]
MHIEKRIVELAGIGPVTSVIMRSQRMEVELLSYGASIRSITLIDGDGRRVPLTLSYEDILESCSNESLAGQTVGPNAGRLPSETPITICDTAGRGALSLTLPTNNGSNQIHGGTSNLATRNWILTPGDGDEGSVFLTPGDGVEGSVFDVVFTTTQPDGLDGWPGNRRYEVRYRFWEEGRLDIEFIGESDATTYLNLTNHTYWLRDGLKLEVYANRYIENDTDYMPTGIASLPASAKAGFEIAPDAVYNHAFLLDNYDGSLRPAAHLYYPVLHTSMTISTDAPALVVYTGDYLDHAPLLGGGCSAPGCAIALEAQELYPYTPLHLVDATHPFHRNISINFS